MSENMKSKIKVTPLGQSGFRFDANGTIIYIDPYLSNSVSELEGEEFYRLYPLPVEPHSIKDADWVLISHIHLDHCDPQTIAPISKSSPQCQFIGPKEVVTYLEKELGIEHNRLHVAQESWFSLDKEIEVFAIPSAHKQIERDASNCLRYLGFLISFSGKKIYHSGDCSVHPEIIKLLKKLSPIDIAFLPVNECNYYRDRQGIVGNMSIRDAFNLASEIEVKKLVPMHYDMFEPNCVYIEEIRIVYEKTLPAFELIIRPEEI